MSARKETDEGLIQRAGAFPAIAVASLLAVIDRIHREGNRHERGQSATGPLRGPTKLDG